MNETWKIIVGYEDYEVSDCGRVRSFREMRLYPKRTEPQLLSPRPAGKGYLSVCLYSRAGRKSFYIHQLVATAFIGPCPIDHEVNHKDLNKTNNTTENLEYMTHGDNNRHAFAHGAICPAIARAARGCTLGRELRPDEVLEIRRRRAAGEMPAVIAGVFGIRASHVINICLRNIWKSI